MMLAKYALLFLLTYLLHSTVLLGAVWCLERFRLLVERDVRESAWRLAAFGTVFTAILHVVLLDPEVSMADRTVMHESAVEASPEVLIDSPAPGLSGVEIKSSAPDMSPAVLSAQRERPSLLGINMKLRMSGGMTLAPVVIWISIAVGALIDLIARFLRIYRRLNNEATCTDPALNSQLTRLAQISGVQNIRVKQTGWGISPVVIPPKLLCLPLWTLSELKPSLLRAMLAHEVAHLKRRDPWWRLAGLALSRMMFFQPLNRIALARLEELSELACDQWAAAVENRSALAESLLACGDRVLDARSMMAASAMAKSGSSLAARIEALFQEEPMRNRMRVYIARAVLTTVLGGVLALPSVALEDASMGQGARTYVRKEIYDPKFSGAEVVTPNAVISITVKGDFKFSDNERDVVALDDSLTLTEQTANGEERVELAKTRSEILRRYFKNGTEGAGNGPAAQALLGRAIPTLLRETGVGVQGRVARIAKAGGADAVLAEIDQIQGDYGRMLHIKQLLSTTRMDGTQLDRAVTSIARGRSPYTARTLRSIAQLNGLTAETQRLILKASSGLDSEYWRKQVVLAVTPKITAAVTTEWLEAMSTIRSDAAARDLVVSVAGSRNLNSGVVSALIKSVQQIGSDMEARRALVALTPHVAADVQLIPEFAEATQNIGSDTERSRLLIGLVDATKSPLDVASAHAIIDSAEGIGADALCRTVLVRLAPEMPQDPSLVERYRAVTLRFSESERVLAQKALTRSQA